ncbi:hypothetical protein [Aureibacillus halotolerans]|uniref:Uncharacterized protein n=1 Tax=Aureibacillus halotolerans TaxID=1508390 RepID=A0A4R6U889_9BACI|nr:hypothetical protein [Aureibacillus halotolerans]TDQ41163.1 hypothetical protein EV213_104161 [Aureibacillus halotolerans]
MRNIIKVICFSTLFIIILSVAFVYSTNTNNSHTNGSSTINQNDVPADSIDHSHSSLANQPKNAITQPTKKMHIPLDTFKIEHPLLEHSFGVPEFVNDEVIVFSIDSSEDAMGNIVAISRDTKEMNKVYYSEHNTYLEQLVGIKNSLYWIERPRTSNGTNSWMIKSMNLSDHSVQIFRKGISEDGISPPVLRVNQSKLTWIENTIENHIVTSTAFMFDPSSVEQTEIASVQLKEKDKNNREGTFFNIQRPVNNGMLIDQSVFKKNNEGHTKSFNLVFYPYDKSSPITIKENVIDLIDFTANEDWVVLCKMGKIIVIDRSTGEVIYEIPGDDPLMTLDTPYIMNNTLYYRFAMEKIMALDLSTGQVQEVTKSRSTTSKILNSDGYLMFSYMEAVNPEENSLAEFNIIKNPQK